MATWVMSWLACCVMFLLVLVALNRLGQFASVAHDSTFFAVMGVCYALVALITFFYFRSKGRQKN